MTNLNTRTLVVVAIVLVVIVGLIMAVLPSTPQAEITSFQECADAGYPIMESFPEQCRTPDGRTFVNEEQPIPDDDSDGAAGGTFPTGGCAVAGCSGQLCVSAGEANDVFTTCEFKPEYACYRSAKCERQANGLCGWTQTDELRACLKSPPAIDVSVQ